MILRIVVPVGICIGVAYWTASMVIGTEVRRMGKLEVDAEDYFNRAMPKILNGFSYDAWRLRATVELIDASNLPKVRRDFATFRERLGPLRDLSDPVGTLGILELRGREIPFATMSARARFRNGEGNVRVRLVKRESGWKMQSFSFRTEAVPIDVTELPLRDRSLNR